jgi:DNA-binding transcriptional regulator YiaG
MFNKEIKQARWKLGLTQKQLSKILDCTECSVQNWESGRVTPKFTVVLAVRWLLQNPEYVKAAQEKEVEA